MSASSSSIGSGALSSAGAGASLGTAIMPGWGTVIGAAIGAVVGAVGGAFTGNKTTKAVKYQRMAKAIQAEREENATYAQYLQYIREARVARAQSLQSAVNAGVASSSLSQGAASSIGSQISYTTQYLAEDYRLNKLYNRYMELAGKNATNAETYKGIHSALDTAVSTAAMAYGLYSGAAVGENPLLDPSQARNIALAEVPNGAQGVAYGTFTPNPGVISFGG